MYYLKIFVGISMGHFVDLTLTWYGGETAMLEHVGEETSLNFRFIPLIHSCSDLFLKLLHPCWDFSLQIYLAYLPGVSHDMTACMIHKMSLVLLIPRCSAYFSAFLITGNFENFVQISIIYQMKPILSNSNISYLRYF